MAIGVSLALPFSHPGAPVGWVCIGRVVRGIMGASEELPNTYTFVRFSTNHAVHCVQ